MKKDTINTLVANNIEALMLARGMNPASLSRASNLNATGIYDILSGKSVSPKIGTIEKIAKALKVPVSAIFEEDQNDVIQEDISILLSQLEFCLSRLDPDRRELLLSTALALSEPAS